MSFLDNLESNLKNLESREDLASQNRQSHVRRQADRAEALKAAPFAEELKKGPFVDQLLKESNRIAHGLRVKVQPAWLGSTLRLQARDRKLELRPGPSGITAVFIDHNREVRSEAVNLEGPATPLAEAWLDGLTPVSLTSTGNAEAGDDQRTN